MICLRRALVVTSLFRNPTREGESVDLRIKGTWEDGLASNRRWLSVHGRRICQAAIRGLLKSISEQTDPRERVGPRALPASSANVKLLQPAMLAGGKA